MNAKHKETEEIQSGTERLLLSFNGVPKDDRILCM